MRRVSAHPSSGEQAASSATGATGSEANPEGSSSRNGAFDAVQLLAALSHFRIARYRLVVETIAAGYTPNSHASAFRSALGTRLKESMCLRGEGCDECAEPSRCHFARLFKTAPPDSSEVLRRYSNLPHPYLITTPEDGRTFRQCGENFSFGITLIGDGLEYLGHFVRAALMLEKARLSGRGPCLRLKRISEVGGGVIWPRDHHAGDGQANLDVSSVTEHLRRHLLAANAQSLTVRFRTPTCLGHGRQLWAFPEFHVLISRMLGRLSSLSYFQHGRRLALDFAGLIDAARRIVVARSSLRLNTWSRRSGTTGAIMPMGGFVGSVTYRGDARLFVPLLALSEFVSAPRLHRHLFVDGISRSLIN